MLDLQSFTNENTGKSGVGDTPQNIGECVGLIEVWNDNLGLPHIWGNAIDLLKNADPSHYDVVYNKLGDTSQFPPDGAIVVLGKPYGQLLDGTYAGHTGISKGSDGNTLRLFQQNDPDGSTPHMKDYTYDACLGWLIPKVTIPTTALNTYGIEPTNLTSVQVVYDTWHKVSQGEYISKSDYDSKVNSLQGTIDNLNGITKDKDQQIAGLNTKVSSLEGQITDLQTQLGSKSAIADKLPDCQKQLEQAIEDRSNLNDQLSEAKKINSGLSGTSYKTVSTQILMQELFKRLLVRLNLHE